MFFRLLALFVLVPIAELALLIRLGEIIGLWPTLGLIVLTGIAGSALAKQQGFSTLRRLQRRMSRGEMPGRELVDGVIILIAGAFLLTPGVLTDVVGFLGLLPLTRPAIRAWLIRQFKQRESASFRIFWTEHRGEQSPPRQSSSNGSEEATYEVIDKSPNEPRNGSPDDS
jgi:UPF0716 protein FxsA